MGRVGGAGRQYLLDPLLEKNFDFEASVLLGKSGRSMWIDNGKAFLQATPIPNRWIDAAGWSPQLDWPTDADIVEHQRDFHEIGERATQALDPHTTPERLAELAKDPHEAVRESVAANPSTPPEVVAALCSDTSRRVLGELLRRDNVSPALVERALNHKHPDVRQALAERDDLDDATKAKLALDIDPKVRAALL